MRALIILLAIVVLLALVGWISFNNSDGRSSINLETQEIREDTGEMMNKGSELLKEAEEEVAPDGDAGDDSAAGDRTESLPAQD
jgi:hypothetical protein